MTDFIAMKKILKYIKPKLKIYIVSFIGYTSQTFLFPLLVSVMLGSATSAIVYGDFSIALNGIKIILIILSLFILITGFATYFYVVIAAQITREFKRDIFNAFVKKDIESSGHTGEGIAAINTQADMAANLYSYSLEPIIFGIIGIVLPVITIFILNIYMALVILFLSTIIFIVQMKFRKPLEKLGEERIEADEETIKSVSNILAGEAVIRTFKRENKALIDFNLHNNKLEIIVIRRAIIEMLQASFTTAQGFLTFIVVFGLGGYLSAIGWVSIGTVVAIFPLAGAIIDGINSIGTGVAGLKPSIIAAKKVLTIIEGNEEIPQLDKEINGYDIKIENLNFSYSDSDKNYLTNINLEIKENELVAFVGASGSGKTTLLKTILGLYERKNLPITLGDTLFENNIIKSWRSKFAYVDQSSKLFDMSIEDNLKLVKENATEEEIINALKKVDLENINIKEKAEELSGGQKQRVCIARAILRGSNILVFDEATSALDSETEKEVLKTIESLRESHTILMITHNLKSINNADKIVVLENGEINEIAKHESLILSNEIYKNLY